MSCCEGMASGWCKGDEAADDVGKKPGEAKADGVVDGALAGFGGVDADKFVKFLKGLAFFFFGDVVEGVFVGVVVKDTDKSALFINDGKGEIGVEGEEFDGVDEEGIAADADDVFLHDVADVFVWRGEEQVAGGDDALENAVGIDNIKVEDLPLEWAGADAFEPLFDGFVDEQKCGFETGISAHRRLQVSVFRGGLGGGVRRSG